MRTLMVITLAGLVLIFNNCKKEHQDPPLVITPTVNPVSYSVMAYLITPKDKSFRADYYRAGKACIEELQKWYQSQMANNKTFRTNPVVLDTLTGLHDATWFNNFNGDSISGTGRSYAYYNSRYELQQLLGSNYDSVHHVYFAFVAADFQEETIKGSFGVEGSTDLDGLLGNSPDSWKGLVGHAMGHAFGLADNYPASSTSLMSTGLYNYPNCVLLQADKDSLALTPFFQQP